MTHKTFMEFLQSRMNTPEVSDILIPGIKNKSFPDDADPSNLFAVTPHFLKTCPGNPQKLLEALLLSYNRWILSDLAGMRDNIERCVTANRVVFVEDSATQNADIAIWKEINECMEAVCGTTEDLAVQSNYLVTQRITSNKSS